MIDLVRIERKANEDGAPDELVAILTRAAARQLVDELRAGRAAIARLNAERMLGEAIDSLCQGAGR